MSYGKISDKQREILEFIKDEIAGRGYPPAVREICDAVCLKSTSSVHAHLEKLEKNGYIRRDPAKPRAIEITDDSFRHGIREIARIPVVGRVAAGVPLLAEEMIDDYFALPAEYLSDSDTFMLRVQGESMIGAGIYDGDLILVRRQSTALNGDIVVALIDDSATVKTFYREERRIRLQPENDSMEPIYAENVSILGKVIGLFRTIS